jgi:hypothetical protein
MNESQLALEELKILQSIIARQENNCMKLRGWAIGLVTALTVVFTSKDTLIVKSEYILLACIMIALFLWLEVIYAVAGNRAIKRSIEVEEIIPKATGYKGPKIGANLKRKNTFRSQLDAFNNVRIYVPYAVLALITGAIAVLR